MRAGRCLLLALAATGLGGCADDAGPHECPGLQAHTVPCCSGGSGRTTVIVNDRATELTVDNGRGYALQGCSTSVDISARNPNATSTEPNDLRLTFGLDAGGEPDTPLIRLFFFDGVDGHLFSNQRLLDGRPTFTDFRLSVEEFGDWHVSGRFQGEVVEPADPPVFLQLEGVFEFDTVYFRWLPD